MVWSLIVPHLVEADQECRKNANEILCEMLRAEAKHLGSARNAQSVFAGMQEERKTGNKAMGCGIA